MRNADPSRYAPFAVAIHWVVAFLILSLFILGPLMTDGGFEPPVRGALYAAHKSFGLLVLLLAFPRLFWRLRHKPPPLPVGLPRWQRLLAHGTHHLLYLALFLVPLAGWSLVSTGPHPLRFFDLFDVPKLPLPANEAMRSFFAESHEALASALAFLLFLHIGAAIQHHWREKDDVLLRMTPLFMRSFLLKIR